MDYFDQMQRLEKAIVTGEISTVNEDAALKKLLGEENVVTYPAPTVEVKKIAQYIADVKYKNHVRANREVRVEKAKAEAVAEAMHSLLQWMSKSGLIDFIPVATELRDVELQRKRDRLERLLKDRVELEKEISTMEREYPE